MITQTHPPLPPMLAHIKDGNIDAVRTTLDNGMSPNTQLRYKYMFEDSMLETTVTLVEFAVMNGQTKIIKLLAERGANLYPPNWSLLYTALNFNQPSAFTALVELGVKIEINQKEISRLFFSMEKCDISAILPTIKNMNLPLASFGGEPLRSAAMHGSIPLVQFLLDEGTDINYHLPSVVFPYASTPIIEATRADKLDMVKYLAERGADILITDEYGDRPYTVALKSENSEMAEYLRRLEPEDFHKEWQKDEQLKSYKLPKEMTEYLKHGKLKLEFPNGSLIKWAKLYSYIDTVELKWKLKKLLSILENIDNYSHLLLVWQPSKKHLCCIDTEHEKFHILCTWDEFIADPEKYLNRMVEWQFEE